MKETGIIMSGDHPPKEAKMHIIKGNEHPEEFNPELRKPMCRHCNEPMAFRSEGKTCYLFVCENKECKAWHNAVEVPKIKLAEKL